MATTKQEKRKKFTVGLWMDLKTAAGKPQGMQIWSIQNGETDGKGMTWFTIVSAVDDGEALKLGQDIYSGKVPIEKAEAA